VVSERFDSNTTWTQTCTCKSVDGPPSSAKLELLAGTNLPLISIELITPVRVAICAAGSHHHDL
jgi:hypothetical protein